MPLPEGFRLITPLDVSGRPINLPEGFRLETPAETTEPITVSQYDKTGPAAFAIEFTKGIPSMFLRAAEAETGMARMALGAIPGKWGEERLNEIIETTAAFRERTFPAPNDAWGWVGRTVGEAVPYIALAMASRGIGETLGPFLTAFGIEGGSAYNEAMKAKEPEWKASAEGILVGTINGLIETLAINRFIKFKEAGRGSMRALIKSIKAKAWKAAGKDLSLISGNVLKSMITEGIQESLQEGASIAVPAVISDRFPKNPDGTTNWNAILTAIGLSGLGGAIAGGFITAGSTTLTGISKAAAPTQGEITRYRGVIEKSKISQKKKLRILRDFDEQFGISEKEKFSAIVYRGTTEITPIDFGTWGPGPYYTTDRTVAQEIAADSPGGKVEQKQIVLNNPFFFTSETFISDMAKPELDKIEALEKQHIKETGYTFSQAERDELFGRLLQKRLKAEGYDGIVRDGGEEVIPFYPEKAIKSSLPEVIPQPQQNIYRTEDGKIIWDESKLEYKDGKYIDPETGKVAQPDYSLTRQLEEPAEAYISRIQQQVTQPTVLNEFDQIVVDLNKALDQVEELRPAEEAEMKKEWGKRFGEYRNILDQVDNEIAKAFIARSALAGEVKMQIAPLEAMFDTHKIEVIFRKANTANITETEHLHITEGLKKLFFDGKIPARHEVDALSFIFPRSTIDKLIDVRKRLGQEKFNLFLEGLNIPRALLASYDLSAAMRQGLLLFFRNRRIWAKAHLQQIRAFASPEYAEFVDMQIRTHPRFNQLKKAKIVLTRVGSLTSGEEMFRSDVAEKIPVIGKGVRASERGYVTMLNSLRAYNFYDICEKWEGKGHSDEDYKVLASYLNHATGRGSVKSLGKIMPALSAIFFAPRLTIGRIQVFNDLRNPAIRRIVAGDLLAFAGTAIGLLALASLIRGVEVENDPRSTDFGKVKIGNTRIDFLGGYQQLIRYTAQAVSGKIKSTATGRITPVDRPDVIWRFIQSKLSPATMAAVDAIRGETFLGKQITATPEAISREIYERFLPLFIQDVIDTARDRGWDKTSISASLLAMHGTNVQTYQRTTSAEVTRLKDHYAQELLHTNWDNLGPDIQKTLMEYHPNIKLMEEKARMERESTSFLAKMVKEQDRAARKITKSLPRNVQDEMTRLFVRIPGLQRRISSDWYLNEKRYDEYQNKTSKILNQILPNLITTPFWNTLPDQVRKAILDGIIKDVKETVRVQLSAKATMNDIVELLPTGATNE